MTYVGTIADFDFQPMNVIPSELTLRVKLNQLQNTFMLEVERGSIEGLSKKFGFKVKGNHYDFTSVQNRKCLVKLIESAPIMRLKFIRFL